MRDAGEVYHRVHSGEQRRPVDVSRKITDPRDLDPIRKYLRAAHRHPHMMAGVRERSR